MQTGASDVFLTCHPCDTQDEAVTAWLAGDASALAEGALQLPALLDFPPSLVTAGLVYVARRAAGTYPAWPPCLGALTGASLTPTLHEGSSCS